MTASPAFAENGRLDALGANALGRALFPAIFGRGRQPRNWARFVFFHPEARDFFADWDRAANDCARRLHRRARLEVGGGVRPACELGSDGGAQRFNRHRCRSTPAFAGRAVAPSQFAPAGRRPSHPLATQSNCRKAGPRTPLPPTNRSRMTVVTNACPTQDQCRHPAGGRRVAWVSRGSTRPSPVQGVAPGRPAPAAITRAPTHTRRAGSTTRRGPRSSPRRSPQWHAGSAGSPRGSPPTPPGVRAPSCRGS